MPGTIEIVKVLRRHQLAQMQPFAANEWDAVGLVPLKSEAVVWCLTGGVQLAGVFAHRSGHRKIETNKSPKKRAIARFGKGKTHRNGEKFCFPMPGWTPGRLRLQGVLL